jgi:hypothetical protein
MRPGVGRHDDVARLGERSHGADLAERRADQQRLPTAKHAADVVEPHRSDADAQAQ